MSNNNNNIFSSSLFRSASRPQDEVKEDVKLEKDLDLTKMAEIPIVIGALETWKRDRGNWTLEKELKRSISKVSKDKMKYPSRPEETCCHSDSCEKQSDKASAKNSLNDTQQNCHVETEREKWYRHKAESLPEKETHTILWYFERETDYRIQTSKPEIS